jgi:hypothetical protein
MRRPCIVRVLAPGHAVPGAALDAPEPLDVDVDQLARVAALIRAAGVREGAGAVVATPRAV